MKQTIALLMMFFASTLIGQNRKGEFQLENNSSSHTLYVAFKKIDGNNRNVANTILNRNSNFRNFVENYQLMFDNGFGITESKREEMARNSVAQGKNDESVKKLYRIYKVTVPKNDNASLLKLAEEFEKFTEVEYASLISNEPIEPPIFRDLTMVPTDDLKPLQTYLFGNPGISADYAWSEGITGQGITIRDVEYGLNKNHEALSNQPIITIEPGYSVNSSLVYPTGSNYTWLDHGTGVASILGAKHDNIGVSGTIPDANKFVAYLEWTTLGYDRIAAVTRAIQASATNDIVIYEMQTGGQNGKYVPAEYNNVIWDLTKAATDSGIVVIAAAGNGSENLDAPFYASYNARGNSGAIIVGAGTSSVQHSILSFSTYGSRVNLQGWGQNVMAAGYGNYMTYDGDYNRTYAYFSGTSSATPVVSSAFALVQSYYKQKTGNYLTASALLELLVNTGYPQGGDTTKKIGPLPNIQKAIEQIKTNLPVNESLKEKKLAVEFYPNPAQNFIKIKSLENNPLKIEIISTTGQILSSGKVQKGTTDYDVSKMIKGNYIINITDGNRTYTEKLLKN